MNTISIEQLAEKLGGNLWAKGDMKRIYLDRGYNTRKMSTKTFVFQNEDGEFKVSCHVDCPAQPWQWCKSQEEEIKEGVYADIENALATEVFLIINKEGNVVDDDNEVVALNELYESDYFISKARANKALEEFPEGYSIKEMNRDEFNAEVDRLEEIARPERERVAAEAAAKREAEIEEKRKAQAAETKALKESNIIPENAQRVKHGKFGLGTVISSDAKMIEVLFDNEEFGLKKLMTAFVKLEKVEA